MERELHDLNTKELTPDQINEMEERRIAALDDAGIDEKLVLEEALENRNTWGSYFNENIVRGKDDINFAVRDQWTAVERSEFTRLFKPAMVANEIYDVTKKLIGEQRKNKPDLIVRSLTGRATQEQINLRTDLVRTISYASQNDLVYQTAFKSALMMGFGAFQVGLDYESPISFNKVIHYHCINDPTMCSWDPTATLPHKGDGNWCGRNYILRREEFFATYPYVVDPVSFIDPYVMLDFQRTTKDTICIGETFVKEWFPLIIYKLSNGEVVTQREWEKREKRFENNREFVKDRVIGEIISREIPKIVGERQTQDYRVMHYRLLRDRIIDFSEWPSRQLPIPFVDGNSEYIEGRQYTKSFIYEARDSQKLLNYSMSELAAELKNRRREQWLATPDNIIGYEQQWRNPELQMGALMARPDPKTGQMPIKSPAWEVSQGIFASIQMAKQSIRETLGYSESEATQGKDMSGKARRERKLEVSMSAYVFFDNLNQAVAQGGRITNDLLDHIVGEDERFMTVTRRDGRSENIVLNEKQGEKMNNYLAPGEYDVEIDTGPSFAVQRDVALEYFQETVAVNPQVFNLIADLWADNLDVQQRQLIKDRLKNLVPPEIIAKEEGKPPPPQQPNPEQQMMQAELQFKAQEMQHKERKMQLEEQEIAERAEDLKLRKEKHLLEQAQMILEAKQMQEKMGIDKEKNAISIAKLDHEFAGKIAAILSDVHKTEKQHAHEKDMNKNKPLE